MKQNTNSYLTNVNVQDAKRLLKLYRKSQLK